MLSSPTAFLQDSRKLRLKAGNVTAHDFGGPLTISGFDGGDNITVFLNRFS
jgi:hypothetical protein